MDIERQIRWLWRVNGVLWFLIVSAGLVWIFQNQITESKKLQCWLDGSTLRVASTTDGPYVVTHVAVGSTESEKRWATLPEPIAIVDSRGAEIDLKKLKWRDILGQTASPPIYDQIEVLYVVPEVARMRR